MKMPRVFHQTWKDHDIPEEFEQMSSSWREKHSGWDYVFWTDEMNRNFIKDHFSSFLPIYDGYETNIQRVDAVRYFVLYKYGGLYIDMHFACLANIEPVLGDVECVFGQEPIEHGMIHNRPFIISNAFMGATPGSKFFEVLCKELGQCHQFNGHVNDRVLETTGPFMLSRLYSAYHRKEDIGVLNSNIIYPLTKEELVEWKNNPENHIIQQKLKGAYGIHYYAGTWWKKSNDQ